MTVHFITASRGGDEPHVTSGDDARQNVAHIGNVNYVGKTGDQLSASMTSSNTLRILSGDGFEDVTIENGNPGYNRKDLVVFHAETSPSDNGYITVIKGEETTGDAVVPTYAEGDLNEGDTVAEMPLYVVSLTGVSVGDPEPQFDVLMPYNEFRTSIDPESATITELKTNVRMFNYGHMHIVQMYGYSLPSGNHALGTLPDGLKPIKNMSFDGALSSDTTDHTGNMWITHNGEIYAHKNTSSSDTFSGQMVFFTE